MGLCLLFKNVNLSFRFDCNILIPFIVKRLAGKMSADSRFQVKFNFTQIMHKTADHLYIEWRCSRLYISTVL